MNAKGRAISSIGTLILPANRLHPRLSQRFANQAQGRAAFGLLACFVDLGGLGEGWVEVRHNFQGAQADPVLLPTFRG